MKNFQDFLKKHKKKLIISAIVLIVFIICLFAFKQILSYLNPNKKESVYGDRCELTESIMITDERKEKVKEAIESYENMKVSTIDIKCNLIDIVINVDNSVEEKTVKSMSEEELKYYEIELMVNWPDDPEKAMMGTHHKMINGEMNDHFVW